jgi:hypothetical protein
MGDYRNRRDHSLMNEEYATTAIAIGDLRNASLYFDQVLPIMVHLELIQARDVIGRSDSTMEEIWADIKRSGILPERLLTRDGFVLAWAEVEAAMFDHFRKYHIQKYHLAPHIDDMTQEEYASIEDVAVSTYFGLLSDYGLDDYPLACGGTASMLETDNAAPSPVLTLANLGVIDASNASWEQIAEFRRDAEARRRLRRFRLFAYDTYIGKSAAYIEDDLLTKLADYEETTKQWGFETVQGAMKTVLSSRLSATAAGGAIMSALFGHSPEALVVAATAGVLQLGHVSLELTQRRFALQKLTRDNPVSYIAYSRKKLRAKPSL